MKQEIDCIVLTSFTVMKICYVEGWMDGWMDEEQTEMLWIMRIAGRSDIARLIHKCNMGYALILFI